LNPDGVTEKPRSFETRSGDSGDFATLKKAVASLPAGATHPNSLFLSHVVPQSLSTSGHPSLEIERLVLANFPQPEENELSLWHDNCSQAMVNFPRGLLAIRNSSRALVRAPALSLALLFSIALGVGSNASVYGFVQGLTHADSPLRGAEGIVSILGQDHLRESGPLSRREFRLLRNTSETFDWVDAARITPGDITIGDHTIIASVADVTPDLARALNLPLRGGVIISHRMWQSEFGSRANLPGDRIRVNNLDLPITGVAPSHLRGLYSDQAVDLWTPAQIENLQSADQNVRDLWVVAKIRRSISISQAETVVCLKFGNSDGVSMVPFTGAAPRMVLGLSRIGTLLNFTAGVVFFVASINVASLLLGRALKRSHETSLRIALGATRAQLLGELSSDSIVISVAGGALGALLAFCTARALPALLFEEDAERLVFAPHLLPIVTASVLCVCFTILCGMMPVFATVTDRPGIVLRRESGLPSKGTERLRTGLVLAQITSCYVLVICAVFLFEGLHSALEMNAGHHLGHPIFLTVEELMTQPAVDIDYFNRVERRAKSVTGLQPLTWAARLPGDRPIWESFRIQPPAPLRDLNMDIVWLATDSLKLQGDRLIAGRTFGLNDPMRRDAVVDEDVAAELFGRQTAGMTIEDPSGQPVEIIGVVKRNSTHISNHKRRSVFYNYTDHSKVPGPIADVHFRVPVASPLMTAELSVNVVSSSYFNALELSLAAGRQFPEYQMPGQTRVGIVNQEAADLYFSGKPLGAGMIDDEGVRTEIIGVVRSRAFGRFQQPVEPTIYFPMQQNCAQRMTLILAGSNVDTRTLANLRLKIESLPGRDSAPIGIESLDAHLARTALAPLRIATLLSSTLAFLALVLSVLGLFSTQSDAARERRRELALRIALGAQRWRIVFKVMTSVVQVALAGTAIGTLVSLVFLRVLASESAIFSSPAVWVWLIVALVPTATVFIASVLPAIRASSVDPLTIMRDEH
jgi:ABC-type antimicrobial peptide transport system permease subunit